MDYPLAKALKDGFHQSGNGTRVAPPDKIVARRDHFAYVPTLEELIEACGEQFLRLTQHPMDATWRANTFNEIETLGLTPIEAIARLWLALNKKGDA